MSEHIEFIKVNLPTYAGSYQIGGASPTLRFYLADKPSWWNRMFARWLLGWTWRDGGIAP